MDLDISGPNWRRGNIQIFPFNFEHMGAKNWQITSKNWVLFRLQPHWLAKNAIFTPVPIMCPFQSKQANNWALLAFLVITYCSRNGRIPLSHRWPGGCCCRPRSPRSRRGPGQHRRTSWWCWSQSRTWRELGSRRRTLQGRRNSWPLSCIHPARGSPRTAILPRSCQLGEKKNRKMSLSNSYFPGYLLHQKA